MTDVMTAMKQIEAAAAEDTTEVRDLSGIKIGQSARQGDIYLHRVAADHPRGKAVGAKLAMGDLMNARHIAEAPAECFAGAKAPDYCNAGTFLGPVIVSDKPFTVSHPEHAAMRCPPGVYQVTHQMDARTLERVRD